MDIFRDLYQQLIIDHNQNPKNFFKIKNFTHFAEGQNPLCGDEINIYLIEKNNIIENISFTGSGCAISKASASIMTNTLKKMKTNEAKKLFDKFHTLATTGAINEDLGKLSVLAGVYKYPSRVKCATLAWHTFNGALLKSKNTIITE